MTLLAVERIKLFSTRSPWWCLAITVVVGLAVAGLVALFVDPTGEFRLTVALTQFGNAFLGAYVILVMAALAVTTEYRFGTIKATFTAVPARATALTAKTALVTGVSALVGLLVGFGAWGLAVLISVADLALDSGQEWRAVAGQALLYAAFALIALGVGMLVRQTAAAIAILLVWALVVEGFIIFLIDAALDTNLSGFMPFNNANHFFVAGDPAASAFGGGFAIDYPWGPWASLAYFVGIGLVLWLAGLALAQRRDA